MHTSGGVFIRLIEELPFIEGIGIPLPLVSLSLLMFVIVPDFIQVKLMTYQQKLHPAIFGRGK